MGKKVVAPGWAAAAAEHLDGAPVPAYADFQRAVVTVNSRAYGEDLPPPGVDEEGGGGASCLLVPGVDLCNHECAAKVNAVKGLAPWGHFVVVADRLVY
jgi:hypothetical protein